MAGLPADATDALFWPLLAPDGGGADMQHMDDLEVRAAAYDTAPSALLTAIAPYRARVGFPWLSEAKARLVRTVCRL
jgi:hypothetical protein